MLDPLTAFSVAGTVVQFVDFTAEIFAKSNEIYKNVESATQINQELHELATDLLYLTTKLCRPLHLQGSVGTMSEDEQRLQDLCNACSQVARDMITRLNALKPPGRKRKWKSFQQAIKAAWSEDEMKALNSRLSGYKEAIQMHILVGLRQEANLKTLQLSDRFNSLDANVQRIVTALLDHGHSSKVEDLQAQAMAAAKLLDRTELVIKDLHNNQLIIVDAVREAVMDSIRQAGLINWREDGTQHPQIGTLKFIRTEEKYAREMVENVILESLKYPAMTDRQEEIVVAHQRTFEWIFEDVQEGLPWTNFVHWLRMGSGTYWVNGKAGSGKSTLMRYVSNHEKTRQLLLEWAAPQQVTLSSFYFWNSGTLMQRSQTGLLRALLHEILKQHRGLIPVILPGPWARAYSLLPWHGTKKGYIGERSSATTREKISGALNEPWSALTLMQAFQLLVVQQTLPFKLCFFIDGLDEYDGDHFQIAEMFRSITSATTNIKVCLSSRPLLVFEDAFKSSSNLRLQELTFDDIRRYIFEKLGNNQRFRTLAEKEPQLAPSLVDEVVTKADGVFLWVVLVVNSLLDGLSNRDTFSDLQRRLRLLPADLEDLYRLMMRRIDPFYLSKASETFQLLVAAHEVVDTFGWTPASGDARNGSLTILTLCLADTETGDLALQASIESLNEQQVATKCNEMTDRLKVRCAGLVEVQGLDYTQASLLATPKSGAKVQYLHRTVRDYFMRQDVWGSVLGWAFETNFNPHVALLKSFILQLRVIPESQCVLNRYEIASNAMAHAYHAEQTTHQPHTSLLDQLDYTMTYHFLKAPIRHSTHWSDVYPKMIVRKQVHSSFLLYAVRYGLALYIEDKLNGGKGGQLRKWRDAFLWYSAETTCLPAKPEVVALLLKRGANPEKRPSRLSGTPWEISLYDLYLYLRTDNTAKGLKRRLSVVRLLVEYDANPLRAIIIDSEAYTALSLVQEQVAPILPTEAAELERILKSKLASWSRLRLKKWRRISSRR